MNPYSPPETSVKSVRKGSIDYTYRFANLEFVLGLGGCLFVFVIFAIFRTIGLLDASNALLNDLCNALVVSCCFGGILGLVLWSVGWLIGFTIDLFDTAVEEAGSEDPI